MSHGYRQPEHFTNFTDGRAKAVTVSVSIFLYIFLTATYMRLADWWFNYTSEKIIFSTDIIENVFVKNVTDYLIVGFSDYDVSSGPISELVIIQLN